MTRPTPVPGGYLHRGRFWPREHVAARLLRLLEQHLDRKAAT